jgi:hypothetical protein
MNTALISPSAEPRDRARSTRALRVDTAIVCSAAAAFAHLVAAPGHFVWWPASGLFFVFLGVVQLLAAVLLVYGVDNDRFVLVTIWATIGVIVLYIASRTVGLPMTPPVPFHGGHWVPGRSIVPGGAKYVGPLDLLTLVTEIGVVVTMLTMLPDRSRIRVTNQLMWIGVGLSVAGAAALAV